MWWWLIVVLASAGAVLVVAGNYERRIRALLENPRTQIRIVPRAEFDDQSGVRWSSDSHGNYGQALG